MTIFLSLIFSFAYGLSLVQESKDIECKNSEVSVLVDKRDRFIEVTELSSLNTKKFTSYEFLDSGILLKQNSADEIALIQLTPKNNAILIVGRKHSFTESNCRDTGGSKTCEVNGKSLFWSPTIMSYDAQYDGLVLANINVRHYGVYPNDGTYFLGSSLNSTGLAIIDYGAKVELVYGKLKNLNCIYLD